MRTYVWSLPTRIFHWLLVIGVVLAYVLGEEEEFLNLHSSIGYALGILMLFRILWGLAGPLYSRFRDFPISLKNLMFFFKTLGNRKSGFIGHNPAASLIMLAIILDVLCIVGTGIIMMSSRGEGLFGNFTPGFDPETYKELHEVFVNFLIIMIIMHLLGLATDFFFHPKDRTILSMFNGYKNLEGPKVKVNSIQWILAIIGITAALTIIPYSLLNQQINPENSQSEQSEFEEIDED